jgi:hypothetical protein
MNYKITGLFLLQILSAISFIISVWLIRSISLQDDIEIIKKNKCLSSDTKRDSENFVFKGFRKTTRKPLNLVFFCNPKPNDRGGEIMDIDWLVNLLFAGVDRPLRIIYPAKDKYYNDSVVFHGEGYEDYFRYMKENSYVNFGSFLIGDETMTISTTYYNFTSFVFRMYYNKEFQKRFSNVHYLPLGPKAGLEYLNPSIMIRSSQRRILLNFVGSLRSNRAEALQSYQYKRNESYIFSDTTWADAKTNLDIYYYKNVLRESIFTLCPWGNNEETFRFFESLEYGAIPIFQKSRSKFGDYIFDGLGPDINGTVPIVFIDEWSELDAKLEFYDKNRSELDVLQEKMVSWWLNKKNEFQIKVKNIIDESFKNAYGHYC